MGSITGHKIDYNRARALRGQRHIPSKTELKYPPPPPGVMGLVTVVPMPLHSYRLPVLLVSMHLVILQPLFSRQKRTLATYKQDFARLALQPRQSVDRTVPSLSVITNIRIRESFMHGERCLTFATVSLQQQICLRCDILH